MQTYNTPEQIRILEQMIRIRETLTRIESTTGGRLLRLSDKQYKAYQQYLELLYKTANELEELQ
jgi:hypothetical protein